MVNKQIGIHFGKLQRLLLTLLAAACLWLPGCGYFPESSFELAPEARLPRWFTLPSEISRSEVTVTMDYYVTSSGRVATFTLREVKKQKLAKVSGTLKGLEPLTLKAPQPGFPPGYPSYEIITVNGVTEIIEHRRMEPIFYIVDDANVRAELLP